MVNDVSMAQLESAVKQLPEAELSLFAKWFEEYYADEWDREIEKDILSGKLNRAIQQADADFSAGRCTPL